MADQTETPPVPRERHIGGYFIHDSALKRLVMDAKFAGRITAGECAWLIQFYGLKHA
jgi:hypothetical protein